MSPIIKEKLNKTKCDKNQIQKQNKQTNKLTDRQTNKQTKAKQERERERERERDSASSRTMSPTHYQRAIPAPEVFSKSTYL